MKRTISEEIDNITWYNIVPQSKIVFDKLINTISDLEGQGGSGGGDTPTLQEVTDEGNETINNIVLKDSFLNNTSEHNAVESVFNVGSRNTSFNAYKIESSNGSKKLTINLIKVIGQSQGTFNFPLLDSNATEETLATQEWVRTTGYTVAELAGLSPIIGDTTFVTDSNGTELGGGLPPVGGGAIVKPVFYNGSNWVVYF